MMFAFLLGLGAFAGLLAGLLGIGGGVVLVPGLYFVFSALGFADGFDTAYLMHLCIGTSLFTIIFTGLSSARAHWRKAAIDFKLLRIIGSGLVAGAVLGSVAALYMQGSQLKFLFSVALFCIAGLMIFKPVARKVFQMTGLYWRAGGVVSGFISTLMGIGGATLNVPLMTLGGVKAHCAVGTAAALGVVIAVPASIGFMVIGWEQAGLPPYSAGFVNLAAALCILPMSMAFAPVGAMLAHRLPVAVLRQVFAIFVVLIALKMMLETV